MKTTIFSLKMAAKRSKIRNFQNFGQTWEALSQGSSVQNLKTIQLTVSKKKMFMYENDDFRPKNGRQTVKNLNLSIKPWTNLRGLVPRKLCTKFEDNPDDGFGEEEV